MTSSPTALHPRFRYDGYGDLARIGLIFIHSSVVMDAEMGAMAAPGVSTHTTRIHLPKVTVEGIDAMMRALELEQAARLVGAAPIDVLCFGGTSASFLHACDGATAWSNGAKIEIGIGGNNAVAFPRPGV